MLISVTEKKRNLILTFKDRLKYLPGKQSDILKEF